MVSNYVKKGIISHPIKKKYTREQLASLMYIAVSKTVLSMENIDALFQMQRAHCTAEEAYNYAQKVSDVMGIDPAEWMRNQGVFNTIITGFGVAGDKAAFMSKNLTQLGYDLASFYKYRF